MTEAPPLSEALSSWGGRFQAALVERLLWRLGVDRRDEASDFELAAALSNALELRSATIDRIFFDWRGGRDPGAEIYPQQPFRDLAARLAGRERKPEHRYWAEAEPCSMHIEEVEAIWAAIATSDDWAPLEAKIAAIRRMGEAHLRG